MGADRQHGEPPLRVCFLRETHAMQTGFQVPPPFFCHGFLENKSFLFSSFFRADVSLGGFNQLERPICPTMFRKQEKIVRGHSLVMGG